MVEVTFEHRPYDCLNEGILGRGNTKCQDPVWAWSAYS